MSFHEIGFPIIINFGPGYLGKKVLTPAQSCLGFVKYREDLHLDHPHVLNSPERRCSSDEGTVLITEWNAPIS